MSTPYIIKADGTRELFEREKLLSSLKRAGADDADAQTIVAEVEHSLRDDMPTAEIYTRAHSILKERAGAPAARYSLKRAILDLGPSGFPFEAYIAELFRAEGSSASIDRIVRGACVEHEVDVVSTKDGITTYTEAKFHNSAGFKTDVKVALYVQARIEDIREIHKDARGLLLTNTKFTDQAIQYATCKGLELLSWEYPDGHTLHQRIDRAGVYPITALTTLSRKEKERLLQEKIVLCTSLPEKVGALERAGVTSARADTIFHEVGSLCIPGKGV